MEHSNLLMTAQIQFIEAELSLIHIPLQQYQNYLPTILKLLFPASSKTVDTSSGTSGPSTESSKWANQHSFLNVTITPIESSVICCKNVAEAFFAPKIAQLKTTSRSEISHASISTDVYLVFSVEGAGTEGVVDLTGPLALAGIPLFFITTYFSDFILVPAKAKDQVVQALENRGFAFERSSETFVNPSAHHHRNTSGTSSFSAAGSPTTPPPTVNELQRRTFALLSDHQIVPIVDQEIRLVQRAGRRGNPQSSVTDEIGVQIGLTKCLVHQPRFLSLTLTKDEAASVLLEKGLVSNFDIGSDNVLLGSTEDHLVPITLDLGSLSFKATGIVCGVAGRLVGGPNSLHSVEMSYLSTAKAGTVMVNENDLKQALKALRVGEDGAMEA